MPAPTGKQNYPVCILLVQDDPDHARAITDAIQQDNPRARVHHVAGGQALLNGLRGEAVDGIPLGQVQLIILDLDLPDVPGQDVLDQLKDDDHAHVIPVIVLAASADDADRRRAYAAHANSYLVKPDDPKALADMVGEAQGYWSRWNWPPVNIA